MLLQQIVALLDGELERLGRLREIVSNLVVPSVIDLRAEREPDPTEMSERASDAPAPSRKADRRSVKRAPRERSSLSLRRPKALPETTALSGAIPKAPVVVTAEALAREGAGAHRRVPSRSAPAPEPGSLGSMIRALRLESSAQAGS